jgi:hypothetical protein
MKLYIKLPDSTKVEDFLRSESLFKAVLNGNPLGFIELSEGRVVITERYNFLCFINSYITDGENVYVNLVTRDFENKGKIMINRVTEDNTKITISIGNLEWVKTLQELSEEKIEEILG